MPRFVLYTPHDNILRVCSVLEADLKAGEDFAITSYLPNLPGFIDPDQEPQVLIGVFTSDEQGDLKRFLSEGDRLFPEVVLTNDPYKVIWGYIDGDMINC